MVGTNTEEDGKNSLGNPLVSPSRKGTVKVQIQPSQQKSLTHLPHRDPVDIAFTDLQYTVTEGRKKNRQCSF
ncbi:hypothetical protein RUM44_012138 [Polyplax serrata]|uniref:Uncharacterized protein n=1 Tax=Polyplax serrata TaxID=468196 RepID=A0ABR1BCA8_POLSC